MVLRLGSVNHAKGFILNKLFEHGRVGGSHLPIELLPSGYRPRYRYLIRAALEELRAEGVLQISRKRTGRGFGDHVSLVLDKLPTVRGLINAYRKSVGLPRLGRDLRTLLPD